MTALRQRMLEDLRIRNYAPTTVSAYVRCVAEFANHFNRPPDRLGPDEIRDWQLHLLNVQHASASSYIQSVCALRFFHTNTLHKQVEICRIPMPRHEHKLPVILSRDEVKALLEAPRNLGHRAILANTYADGLRISEVAAPKVRDLDGDRRTPTRGASTVCSPTRVSPTRTGPQRQVRNQPAAWLRTSPVGLLGTGRIDPQLMFLQGGPTARRRWPASCVPP